MATRTTKRRSSRSTKLSRHTRTAHDTAVTLLEQITQHAILHRLQDDAEARSHLAQLQKDAEVLIAAPKLRIGAARRLQGVSSRRETSAHLLFEACAEVRKRIKVRYRGPKHIALRKAFGEGLPASPAKPQTVLLFARQILDAALGHGAQLREVRVGPPTLQRIDHLRAGLQELRPERAELRIARRQVAENLSAVADRVNATCAALIVIAARVCPPEAVSLLPVPVSSSRGQRQAEAPPCEGDR